MGGNDSSDHYEPFVHAGDASIAFGTDLSRRWLMSEFLLNTWYMFAWEEELKDSFLSRTILGVKVMIYRASSGEVVALQDRCPHRFAPLSLGSREGDNVACAYHGLTFDKTGACVRNPYADVIPSNCRIDAYPVACRNTAIWIWMGDPAKANANSIPDLPFLEQPGNLRRALHLNADYRLVLDNLMDLTHIEYIHRKTFGGQGVIFKGKYSATQEGDKVRAYWDMPNLDAPAWAKELFKIDGTVDQWFDAVWHPASVIALEIGLKRHGLTRNEGLVYASSDAHAITPATANTCHYFFNWPPSDVKPEEMFGGRLPIEHEDVPIIEAVQESMREAEFWSQKPVILHVDAGAVRVRRRLARLIREENGIDEPAPAGSSAV
jgi:vanillate O-demethylase monooxygenase subunit